MHLPAQAQTSRHSLKKYLKRIPRQFPNTYPEVYLLYGELHLVARRDIRPLSGSIPGPLFRAPEKAVTFKLLGELEKYDRDGLLPDVAHPLDSGNMN